MKEQKIKQDTIAIGQNVKRVRLKRRMKQVELVKELRLRGVDITWEPLVKIERGKQHIYASQCKAIKESLDTTFDGLLR